MTDSELKRVVETALHGEVRLRGRSIAVAVEDGMVVLKGEVPEVAEKRLAVNLIRRMREVGDVKDQLRIFTSHGDMTDKQITQHIEDAWQQDLAVHDRQIQVQVTDGVVTLTGTLDSVEEKCFAGLLAWWVPGVVDVNNEITLDPPHELDDEGLLDVIRQALEKDVLVNAINVRATAQQGIVTLLGSVNSDEERMAAEHDCYYIDGVVQVINRLDVTAR